MPCSWHRRGTCAAAVAPPARPRIHRPGRTFLRSCPVCETRAGGVSLPPGQTPLDLTCRRHRESLVNGEDVTLDQAPEVHAAVNRLHCLRRRHGDQIVSSLYQRVHHYLADDWRGTRRHRLLVQRWSARQHRMDPGADANELFVRSHHWSMLPESSASLDLSPDRPSHRLPRTTSLTRSASPQRPRLLDRGVSAVARRYATAVLAGYRPRIGSALDGQNCFIVELNVVGEPSITCA